MTLTHSPELDAGNRITSPLSRQQTRRSGRRRLLAAAMLLAMPLVAQSPGIANAASADGPFGSAELTGGIEARMEGRRIAMLNIIRQKAMISDAGKLLHLAQELSDDANAGGARMSQAERMHKAAEIEKLAKNVKEKMINAIGAPEPLGGQFNAWR